MHPILCQLSNRSKAYPTGATAAITASVGVASASDAMAADAMVTDASAMAADATAVKPVKDALALFSYRAKRIYGR